MNDNLVALLFIFAVVALFVIAEVAPAIIHRVIKGHWPEYKAYGVGEYNFDMFDEKCERCK